MNRCSPCSLLRQHHRESVGLLERWGTGRRCQGMNTGGGVGSWWSVWAKSWPHSPAEVEQWLPLHQHLDDTQGVAGLLFDDWVPGPVVRTITEDAGISGAEVRDGGVAGRCA